MSRARFAKKKKETTFKNISPCESNPFFFNDAVPDVGRRSQKKKIEFYFQQLSEGNQQSTMSDSDETIYINAWRKLNYTTIQLIESSDKREFFKIDHDKRQEMAESGKPGYCFQQNFGLYVDKFKKVLARAGIKNETQLRENTSRWMLEMSLMRFKTHLGINHCAVVYTQGGVEYLEDRSNAVHKKIRYKTWLETNKPVEVEELNVKMKYDNDRVWFGCGVPVNVDIGFKL